MLLILFRAIASLGIGGEWAAGATMVAEVVPEKWRLEGGLRATGAGFCYNAGRIVAAGDPFLVGTITSGSSQDTTFQVLLATGVVTSVGY